MFSKLAFSMVFMLAAVGLSGCATQAERDAANEASCTKWGTGPGNPRFAECMAMLRGVDATVAAADAQRMMAAGAALQGAAGAVRAPDSIRCTSVQQGIFTNTDCH